MRTTIVIPTYNERTNILLLLDALTSLAVPDLSILVVDDSSPDGTGDLVRARADQDPKVRLLSRPQKEGLGKAYTAAFMTLLDEAHAPDVILQMDADFSHDPQDVPRLLAALEHADLAIGSRYTPGGSVSNWNWPRRVLSRSANTIARHATHAPIHDLTGGFNAWRATTLSAVRPSTITADGYGYLVELKIRATRHGTRIAEIPINFTERREGASKMSLRVIWEAVSVVLRLAVERVKSSKE